MFYLINKDVFLKKINKDADEDLIISKNLMLLTFLVSGLNSGP